MEEIRIKSIEKKDSGLVIVKYDSIDTGGNPATFEATLNTKWQSEEVNFLEADVGIGGSVKVLIVQKGDYTNITKVDFSSAVKGENTGKTQNATTYMSEKEFATDERIAAQVILKGAVELTKARDFGKSYEIAEFLSMAVNELTGAYNLALSNVRSL